MNKKHEITTTGMEDKNRVLLAVVADTHLPDRVDGFHPDLLDELRQKHVDAILHAGDICVPEAILELEQIAPVFSVLGNRDIFFMAHLPEVRLLNFAGFKITLLHGHGKWIRYLLNKLRMYMAGYRLEIFLPDILKSVPESDVVVFGHLHRPVALWYNEDTFLFNPGSSSQVSSPARYPSYGILRLEKGKKVEGDIIELNGYKIRNRRWIKNQGE